MNNRIQRIEVRDHCLDPATAEVRISVTVERWTPATEIRGRLMGPRCVYASTVEIAYPLRPLFPVRQEGLVSQVLIPEASLWDPQSPFLYEGPVELWQEGQRCNGVVVTHGLRSVGLGARGLRVNGRPLTLVGRRWTACSPEEARELRRAGCNLLLAPVEPATLPLWDLADRAGFFVLGELADDRNEVLAGLPALAAHPCCLGWLVPAGCDFLPRLPPGGLVGMTLDAHSPGMIPEGASFVVGSPSSSGGEEVPLLVPGTTPVILGSVR
jgi:hypothetical protein